ncbi:MAG: HD domain-containing protein [Candidatus Korarchaeota archaeon]
MRDKKYDIRDPIHGYVYLNELERKIVDSPEMQRLRRIYQLQGASFIYPGATHTRFLHSLGAMHLAGKMGWHLLYETPLGDSIKESEKMRFIQILRLAGLLHDIGHGPWSHNFEATVYPQVAREYKDRTLLGADRPGESTNHELVGKVLIEHLEAFESPENEYSITRDEVNSVLHPKKNEKDILSKLSIVMLGPFSADVMDFLLRDSYYTGAIEYGHIDHRRLINSLIYLPEKDTFAVHITGAYTFYSFLLARASMFEAVYFHKTGRAVERLIADFLTQAFVHDKKINVVESLFDYHKFILLDEPSILTSAIINGEEKTRDLARRILNREIPWHMIESKTLSRLKPVLRHLPSLDSFAGKGEESNLMKKLAMDLSARAGIGDIDWIFIDTSQNAPIPPQVIAGIDVYKPDSKELCQLKEVHPLYELLPTHLFHIRLYTDKTREDKSKIERLREEFRNLVEEKEPIIVEYITRPRKETDVHM